jgi:cobalt-zinc-cadmium efflux system protein
MAHTYTHHHTHENPEHSKETRLLAATGLNIIITIVEIIGGLVSNSLALLSDAFHNLGDTFAVFLAYLAHRVSNRDATEKKTFGFKRIEILAAFFNAVVLIVITIFLFIAAYHRLLTPSPVRGLIMFVVAVAGLVANLAAVIVLKKETHKNLNIRAAYLHMLGDTISSVAVIIGSGIIYFFRIYWIDPVITLIIGLYIIKEAYSVLKETIDILMQGTPTSIKLSAVVDELVKNKEIDNIHHVHSWKLDDRQIHFECHADLTRDLPISETDVIRLEIEQMLKNKFGISHVTIQFEYNCCAEKSMIHPKRKN